MSESKPFTLAVVKGDSRGQVLRTDKRRIAVGSGRDNDLSIEDPQLSLRHFLVLIDHGRWRIHTFSKEKSITVDRRWSHPKTGERGAVITAANTEILLYPGLLEPEIIEREIGQRTDSVPLPVVTEEDKNLVTQIGERPVEFRTSDGVKNDPSNERTDAIDLSTMPTITGERLPDDIRLAARARLLENRGGPTLPLFVPGSDRSLVAVTPELEPAITIGPPEDSGSHEAATLRPPDATPPINAWGDPTQRRQRTPTLVPNSEPVPSKPSSKDALRGVPRERSGRVNAWGDPADRAIETANGRELPPLRVQPPPPQIARILAIEDLAHLDEPALSILRDPDGEMATSIRLLGTRIEEFMRMYGYRAYMVSSPEPLTGKTTTAANLALALAEDTHRRIALIEANFRYPRFAEIFGIPDDYGLIPLLEGQVQLSEAIAKIADRNLVILPAGGRHPSPAELLSSPRFKALLAELANTVDIAVVDAPAVTPFADANILLPLVDAAVLVVSEHKTHANWIERAQKQLGEARILGAVYNRIPKSKMKKLQAELKERMRERRT